MYQYLSPSETTEICLVAVIVLRAIFDCHISVLKDFSWHSVLSFLLVVFFFFFYRSDLKLKFKYTLNIFLIIKIWEGAYSSLPWEKGIRKKVEEMLVRSYWLPLMYFAASPLVLCAVLGHRSIIRT